MYVFVHISYENFPVTLTQLYTSLVVLVNEWHKGELKHFAGVSLQSQFTNTLIEYCRKIVEDSGDFLAKIGKSLIQKAKEFD